MTRNITTLLASWKAGDETAGKKAMEQIYTEVRAIAGQQLQSERPDHTLQPTALANEVYLRVIKGGPPLVAEDRHQLLGLVARQVRQVLTHHARNRERLKRGGDQVRIVLGENDLEVPAPCLELLDLDRALTRLAEQDSVAAQVVELRFFGGLTESEIAAEIAIGTATVARKWRFAKNWLHGELFS